MYRHQIQEVSNDGQFAYGLAFVICSNTEVIVDWLGGDIEGNDKEIIAKRAFDAASKLIRREKFDSDQERSFRAYNGGPLRALVVPKFFRAELDEEGDYSENQWKGFDPVKDSELAKLGDQIASAAVDAMQAAIAS